MIRDQRAEAIILAGAIENQHMLNEVTGNLNGEHFTSDMSKSVFNTIVDLSNKGNLTYRTVEQELKKPKEKAYLQNINKKCENKTEFEYNMKKVNEMEKKRRVERTINYASTRLDQDPVNDLTDAIVEGISSITVENNEKLILSPTEYADKSMQDFTKKLQNPDEGYGIRYSYDKTNGESAGFPSLDRVLRGARPSDLILIGAETGHGKTAFGINLARSFSLMRNYRGWYGNAEMENDELISRLLAPIANVDANDILFGELEGTEDERKQAAGRIGSAHQMLKERELYLSDIPDLSVQKIKAVVNQFKLLGKPLDYVIVDYLQRMDDTDSKYDNEKLRVYNITKKLKMLAKSLKIPIIVLAQLNFDGYVEEAKKARNECDAVLFLKPIDDEDEEVINNKFIGGQRTRINYKLVKDKVRRNNDKDPIYCSFEMKRQNINEVRPY